MFFFLFSPETTGTECYAILTTKLLLRKVSNYYILKAKAPTAKPFADICSIEEPFHIIESRPYLTSHVITTEKKTQTQMAYRLG